MASQSGQSAEEIARKIESVQTSTRDAVKVIEGIVSFIGQLNVSAARISDAVDGQTQTANQISVYVAKARRGVEEIARSIAEVAKDIASFQDFFNLVGMREVQEAEAKYGVDEKVRVKY